jgi:hypothetical protein
VLDELAYNRAIVRFGEKVKRASEHLKMLNEAAERFVKEHGYPGIPCFTEANSQSTKMLLKVERVPGFPEFEWGVIAGDAVHCFRSALDQLVTALWIDKPNTNTGFPITLTKRGWVEEAPRMIWSVPAPYVAVIDRAQPYHRGDIEKACDHPLAVLHSLWNLDKHRTIPTIGLVPRRIDIKVTESPGVTIGEFRTKPGVPLKPGAVIAVAKIMSVDPNVAKAYVKVDAHMATAVGFGDGGELPAAIRAKPVVKTFHEFLMDAMGHVLQDFAAVQNGLPFLKEWD